MISIISFYIRSLALQLLFLFYEYYCSFPIALLQCIILQTCPGCATISLIASADVRHRNWWVDGQPGIFAVPLFRGMGDTLSGGKSDFRGKKSSFKFIRGKGQKLSEVARSLQLWAWGIIKTRWFLGFVDSWMDHLNKQTGAVAIIHFWNLFGQMARYGLATDSWSKPGFPAVALGRWCKLHTQNMISSCSAHSSC